MFSNSNHAETLIFYPFDLIQHFLCYDLFQSQDSIQFKQIKDRFVISL
jgi:hypothetical protein